MQLVKTGQAANELGLSRFQVLRLIRSGQLPAQRMGRDHWIRRTDLDAFTNAVRWAHGPSALPMGSKEVGRLTEQWTQMTSMGGSIMIDALLAIGPDVPPLVALPAANVESAGQLTAGEDRDFRDALAEVLANPAAPRILFAGFGERFRPALAEALATRREREATLVDYADADLQMTVIDLWARRLQKSGFRRRSVNVLLEVAADWDDVIGRRGRQLARVAELA